MCPVVKSAHAMRPCADFEVRAGADAVIDGRDVRFRRRRMMASMPGAECTRCALPAGNATGAVPPTAADDDACPHDAAITPGKPLTSVVIEPSPWRTTRSLQHAS